MLTLVEPNQMILVKSRGRQLLSLETSFVCFKIVFVPSSALPCSHLFAPTSTDLQRPISTDQCSLKTLGSILMPLLLWFVQYSARPTLTLLHYGHRVKVEIKLVISDAMTSCFPMAYFNFKIGSVSCLFL